jgi:hypothetical protein
VHDACDAPLGIGATPFVDVRTTVTATSAASDPQPSCTVAKNSNTVWYRFTPPTDGRLALDTLGSSYDTVLTVYTGACAAPAEVACSDDTETSQLSELSLHVTGGTPYLIEVADYGLPNGGTLVFHADFSTCGNGSVEAGEACDEGAANGQGACCTQSCALVDADGDGTCDDLDVCPAAADPAQADADGDGLGDACDPCVTTTAGQTAWQKPKLTIRGLGDGRSGNDNLTFSGRFRMTPGTFAVDPIADGASVVLRSAGGFPLWTVTLPPGAGSSSIPGWSNARGALTFSDRRPGGTGGVSKMTVRDLGGGLVDVVVVARKTTFAFAGSDGPFAGTIVPGGAPAGAAGECGEIRFNAPPALPSCFSSRNGSRVICK